MQVHKFGGVGTSNYQSLQRIFDIITSAPKPVIFTLSASYGITNYLVDILKGIPKPDEIPEIINFLKKKHFELLNSQNKFVIALDKQLNKLERLLYGTSYTEELTPRTRDLIISFGERLIVEVMREFFKVRGVDIKSLSPEKYIVTNGLHSSSNILLDETETRCKQFKDGITNDDIIIVPGYFGASVNNVTTLLGRSGTDYSATALAYAFDAKEVIIWKDVEGFMTADPKIVPKAINIQQLSYDEASELAFFGAKILHPRSVLPAKIKSIPIYIRNLGDENKFTRIHNRQEKNGQVIQSISHSSNLAILRVYKYAGGINEGNFSEISNLLHNSNVDIKSIATSQSCISLLINSGDVSKSIKTLEVLHGTHIEHVEYEENMALICIVGEEIGNTPGIASKVFQSVGKENINVVMISSGASKVAFHFSVKESSLTQALNLIHNEFFSNS